MLRAARVALSLGLAGCALAAAAGGSFEQRLALQGIAFAVSSPNAAVGNTVRIAPSGLLIDNTPLDMAVEGQVVGAEVADLNGDGSPELYVYLRGAPPEERGSLLAVSANRRKSLSGVALPELGTHRGADKGYQGHDEMAVVGRRFVRRFPLYGQDGDATKPTGRTRQLQYRLAQGEASWVLKLDRMVDR
jgi:hypothetical protein